MWDLRCSWGSCTSLMHNCMLLLYCLDICLTLSTIPLAWSTVSSLRYILSWHEPRLTSSSHNRFPLIKLVSGYPFAFGVSFPNDDGLIIRSRNDTSPAAPTASWW